MSDDSLRLQNNVQSALQLQLHNTIHKYYKHIGIFYKIILTTILASMTTKIFDQTDTLYNKMYMLYSYMRKLLFYKKKNTISLVSKKIWTKYGRYKNMISEEKLGILYYVSKHLNNFKDLYGLAQDCRSYRDHLYCDEADKNNDMDSYYTISQDNPVEIYKDKHNYITLELVESMSTNNQEGPTSGMEKIITDNLMLCSNLSLQEMSYFIDNAKQERLTDLQNDINRYIYTYLGEDDEKNPIFEKELFKPYCKFNKLVGSVPKKIEESFDFFTSDDGREWYEKRNLPYQMTVLLYGIPGTGKSCIASAVATKFNLHIVRIKLSLIKTNYQFIKAFKNKVFCDTKIEYKNILYLFDELDTEQNSVSKNRTTPVSSKKVTFTKEDTPTSSLPTLEQKKELINKYSIKEDDLNNLLDNIFTGPKQTNQDSLTLGTILEELNGINQMYGRKMFIISNHPEKLDPALLRPGRIDLKYKLDYLSYCDILELIDLFFPNSDYTQYETDTLRAKKITAAKLTNLCKISKTKENVMSHIYTIT